MPPHLTLSVLHPFCVMRPAGRETVTVNLNVR